MLGEVAPEKRGGFLRKAKNLLLDIEPKTVRKEIRNNNLLWTRYSVESNSSDESQGLDRHQAKMSELNENGLNPQSKSYIDKDNANKTNLQEVKRGLEAGEIEDVQESLKKKASDPDEAEQSVDIIRGNYSNAGTRHAIHGHVAEQGKGIKGEVRIVRAVRESVGRH